MAATVVVRFFKRNDKGWKNLWYRQVREGTLAEAIAWAYHTVAKSTPAAQAQIMSIEFEQKNGLVEATKPAEAQNVARR